MKCVHCSTPITRDDWFCPNCKRGIRRTTRASRFWVPAAGALAAGAAAGVLAIAWIGARPAAQPVVEEPLVPVSIRTVEPAPEDSERLAAGSIQAAVAVIPPVPERAAEKPGPEKKVAAAGPARDREVIGPIGVGAVTVTTDSDVETFVYLNGGSLLGKAPLQAASIPAGKQTLVFWSPSIGGRSTRRINMRPGQNMTLIHSVAPRNRFAPLEGG